MLSISLTVMSFMTKTLTEFAYTRIYNIFHDIYNDI